MTWTTENADMDCPRQRACGGIHAVNSDFFRGKEATGFFFLDCIVTWTLAKSDVADKKI